jgi:cytochrome P450
VNAPIQLPFTRPDLLEPPPLLRKLQAQGPVHKVRTQVGDEAWLITGYEQVKSLLADDGRLGRSHPDPDSAPRAADTALFGKPQGNHETERGDTARMRAQLQPHFASGRMRALRPRVDALITGLLDQLAAQGPPADIYESLARPLPILVICELLGVPYADRDQFQAWTNAVNDRQDGRRSRQGLADLYRYGEQLVARKRREPGDDVISRLCEQREAPDDQIAIMSMLLLFAGYETTVVQIGWGVLLLLANPGQYQALCEDTGLVPGAVEEMLRAPNRCTGGLVRYARTDFEVSGMPVRAGDLVLLDTAAASHDEAFFADPDTFDITRRAAHNLAFGHGSHYCLGAPLARVQLEAVFAQLALRFPAMHLTAPPEDLAPRSERVTGGLTGLPVAW